jgi:hypothetical protein
MLSLRRERDDCNENKQLRLFQGYIWQIFDDEKDGYAIGVNAEHKPSATRRQETSTNDESGRT